MEYTPADNKGKSLLRYAFPVAAVLILLAASYTLIKKQRESVVYTRQLMGTVVQLTLVEGDRGSFDKASEAAFGEIARLEAVFSSYKPDSDVSRINAAAGSGTVEVRPEVMDVLRKAVTVASISGGAFDPTVGALSRAWGPSGEKGEVPSEEEIKGLLGLVDYRAIVMDEHAGKAGLKKAGIAINLGGVAKGYIVARAAAALQKNGITRAIIHAGGDMAAFQRGESEPFKIGIQHPREKKLLGEIHLYNGAVATSGDYERFFEKDSVRYHHILDPKTGWPARASRAVTIVARDQTMADALSTAVFVLGPEKGMALIEGVDGVEGVIIGADGRVYLSTGFQGKIY